MKELFLLLVLFLILANLRAEDKAPKPFTDSSIERTLGDGSVQKFDGNEYKIVKRGSSNKPEEKVIIKEKTTYKKNAIKAYVGNGPSELEHNGSNRVDLKKDAFFGIGYERMLNEEFSIEAIGTTNKSLMIGGGFHF